VTQYAGGGQARDEMVPDAARVVRQVFAWVGCDRLTLGEGWRRLTQAGEMTRTGTTVWDRRVVWGILKQPASHGAAAFGKPRLEPRWPRRRAQRNRPVQPRRAVSVSDVPPEAWSTIPVPALVESEVFAAVQAQWRANKRHARQPSRRGALYLRPGLLQCQHCGYAFYGKRLSPSARQGKPRAYASYRCLGTDAYRCGGARLCQHTPVQTALLDLAGWQAFCPLLPPPSGSPKNIGAACSRRPLPNARRWPRSKARLASGVRASPA
jgi:site-specific DNA recombinase